MSGWLECSHASFLLHFDLSDRANNRLTLTVLLHGHRLPSHSLCRPIHYISKYRSESKTLLVGLLTLISWWTPDSGRKVGEGEMYGLTFGFVPCCNNSGWVTGMLTTGLQLCAKCSHIFQTQKNNIGNNLYLNFIRIITSHTFYFGAIIKEHETNKSTFPAGSVGESRTQILTMFLFISLFEINVQTKSLSDVEPVIIL